MQKGAKRRSCLPSFDCKQNHEGRPTVGVKRETGTKSIRTRARTATLWSTHTMRGKRSSSCPTTDADAAARPKGKRKKKQFPAFAKVFGRAPEVANVCTYMKASASFSQRSQLRIRPRGNTRDKSAIGLGWPTSGADNSGDFFRDIIQTDTSVWKTKLRSTPGRFFFLPAAHLREK